MKQNYTMGGASAKHVGERMVEQESEDLTYEFTITRAHMVYRTCAPAMMYRVCTALGDHVLPGEPEISPDLIAWCDNNTKGRWSYSALRADSPKDLITAIIEFENENDAFAFRMRWL